MTRNYVLETGFKAEWGEDGSGPRVSVLCEYDALPEIGHACGHNLIAEVGAGAGLGIKAALQAAKKNTGKSLGKVSIHFYLSSFWLLWLQYFFQMILVFWFMISIPSILLF